MGESTGELLMSAAREMRHRLAEAMAEHDVTPGQARALRLLGELGPARPSLLAERLRIAPRSATEVVDGLEARGWVRREADPGDRRATIVVATEQGQALRAVLDGTREMASTAFLERLHTADRAELDRILRVLVARD